MGGPMQKQMAKAMPTWARAFARLAGVVTSERIALLELSVTDHGRVEYDVHRQLDIALTQPPNDTRKHVRRESGALYPPA